MKQIDLLDIMAKCQNASLNFDIFDLGPSRSA